MKYKSVRKKQLERKEVEIYQCPDCGHRATKEEISRTWDHAGPHCSNCGLTSMTMFAAVVETDNPEGIQNRVGGVIVKMKAVYRAMTGKELKVYP